MSKEKESYYDWIKLHALCGHSLSKNVTDYVEKLENLNNQMLEALIVAYKTLRVTQYYATIDIIQETIEKATGMTIEEILNNRE